MGLFGKTRELGTIRGNLRAQFGLAVSLGLMIGLIPKISLVPWCIGLIAIIAPINLGAALVAIIVGSCLSLMMDSAAHFVGQTVLSNGSVLNWMTQLNDLPGFAWTRLNNTVVMGLSTIAILASIPAYLIAHAMFRDPRLPNSNVGKQVDTSTDYPTVHTPTLQES